MLIVALVVLVLLVAVGGAYVGLVVLIARRRAGDRWRRFLAAAIAAWVVASAVLLVGVPYTEDSRGPVAVYAALVVLVLTPLLAPRLPRPVAWLAAGAVVAAFAVPVVRVELLTLAHGQELLGEYDPPTEGPLASRLFVVFDHSEQQATALHVVGEPGDTAGYFVEFSTQDGPWSWRESQAWLWSDSGNMRSDCPYPVSALLLLHGVGAVDC